MASASCETRSSRTAPRASPVGRTRFHGFPHAEGQRLSADFHNALSIIKGRGHCGQCLRERIEQRIATAVAKADPDQSSLIPRPDCEEQQILVLADDDPVLADRPSP